MLIQTVVLALTTAMVLLCSASENPTCGMKNPEKTFVLCHCDSLCEIYQDCCYGYMHQHSSNMSAGMNSHIIKLSTCSKLEGTPQMFYIVSKPTSDKTRMRPIQSVCNSPNKTNPREALPVYDIRSRTNFKNIYCYVVYAVTNQIDSDYGNVSYWTVQVSFRCFQRALEQLLTNNFLELLAELLTQRHCTAIPIPPKKSNTRICFEDIVGDCEAEEACPSFQSPVESASGKLFRNRQCAACHGIPVSSLEVGRQKPVDNKDTILTLNQLDPFSWPSLGFIPCDQSGECHNKNCSEDEMFMYMTCIKPISMARGFLHGMDFQIDSNGTFSMDTSLGDLGLYLSTYIHGVDQTNLYVTGNVKTMKKKDLGCRNFVQISVYLRTNIDYELYLNVTSQLENIYRIHKNDIEQKLIALTNHNNTKCSAGKYFSSSSPETGMSFLNDLRLMLFVSVFVSIFVICVFISVVKYLKTKIMNRPTRSNDSQNHETE